MTDILRGEWGFDGFVVSDCGAIYDIWKFHKFVKTEVEASVLAVRGGHRSDVWRRVQDAGSGREAGTDYAKLRSTRQ